MIGSPGESWDTLPPLVALDPASDDGERSEEHDASTVPSVPWTRLARGMCQGGDLGGARHVSTTSASSPDTSPFGPSIPVDLHAPSVDSLHGEGDGSLDQALRWVFPLSTQSLGDVDLVRVEIAPDGYWDATATSARWVRPIRCVISAAGHVVYFELDSIPWLCDDRATATSIDRPEYSVGGHRGLYQGRPLVPRLQLVPRPGLRREAGPRRLSWVLVPDIGTAVTFTGGARTVRVRFGRREPVTIEPSTLAGMLAAEAIDEMQSESGLSRGASRRLRNLVRDGGAQNRRFAPETLDVVDDALGLTRPTWNERVLAIVDRSLEDREPHRERLVDELSRESLQYRPYGDLLRRTISRGALRGFRDYLEVEPSLVLRASDADDVELQLLRRLAGRLKARVQTAVDETIRAGSPGGVVAPADDRGTVASIEASRTITRFGPAGERRRGANRLWLRGLHPERRGEICPLLTPESEDLGLIRSAAIGAAPSPHGLEATEPNDQHADLSVAAGLIPFLNHDDPTRASIAARMLRQAVPISGAQRPRVETAVADWIASQHGVIRTPVASDVVDIGENWIALAPADGREQLVIGFGPATPSTSAVDGRWRTLVRVGDRVYTGDLLAAAPDVVIADDTPHLAQGRDCLVAYMPWHGWNFEDAIVVSAAITREFSSCHYVRSREPLDLVRGEQATFTVAEGAHVIAGDVLVAVTSDKRVRRRIRASADGTVAVLKIDGDEVLVELRVDRPLEIGDKLTNRHGAKGVVARILPESEMPSLPDGRRVEMILNPLGVIRRLNLSQLFETHWTLRADLMGSTATDVVDRRVPSIEELASDLAGLGAPGGRLPLSAPDGSLLGTGEGVVVGWQQILKLDHLASNKERARFAGSRSPVSQQPAKGSTWVAGNLVGGAQRLGEMEFWAMQAVSADRLVRDAHDRSDHGRESIMATAAHLRVAGLHVTWDHEGAPSVERDLDGSGLIDLPADVVSAIEEPRLTTAEGSAVHDPLHDYRHGADEDAVRCACGETGAAGAVCEVCGTRTRLYPGAERRTFKYRIRLARPVRHPWAPEDPSLELRAIPLLPPAFRPYRENHLDHAYRWLIAENARASCEPDRHDRRLEIAVTKLLGELHDLPSSETIASRLNGKRGLLRRTLRGRDTDYAARGVMVPDPNRDPETIGIPQRAADKLGFEEGGNHVVLVNRQPTLLPTNLVALKADIVAGSAFRIHPLLCARLAGDFDGDEVTVHRPMGDEAIEEAWALFRPASSFRHIANGQPMTKSDLDVALGLWLLGGRPNGRASLADRMGLSADHHTRLATGPIEADEMNDLVHAITASATGEDAIEAMRELFAVGVDEATGWSFSALELVDVAGKVDPDNLVESVPDSALGEAIAAGQAGKPKGLAQMLVERGSLEDFNGEMTPSVDQSFLRGLADDAYFATTPGGLRALSDKKLVTPLAGGLTKSLIEAAYDVVLSEGDCGSERDGFGAVLTCEAKDGVCARCYEASGGPTTAIGARVGLLAAFAIGERSTQNAMKAFQGGTTLAVGGNVARLRALFGDGRIVRRGADDTSLARIMRVASSADDLVATYSLLRAEVDDCLDASVPGHHLEVVWRRLLAADASGGASPLSAAQWPGSAFVHATTRGDLSSLVGSLDSDASMDRSPSPLRLAVIQGGA